MLARLGKLLTKISLPVCQERSSGNLRKTIRVKCGSAFTGKSNKPTQYRPNQINRTTSNQAKQHRQMSHDGGTHAVPLTQEQQAVVKTATVPGICDPMIVQVNAAAGTGKTTTLVALACQPS